MGTSPSNKLKKNKLPSCLNLSILFIFSVFFFFFFFLLIYGLTVFFKATITGRLINLSIYPELLFKQEMITILMFIIYLNVYLSSYIF